MEKRWPDFPGRNHVQTENTMGATRRFSLVRLIVALVTILFMTWALAILAEYCGWPFVREAGGQLVRASH
jgi:hypothetical protein